MKVRDLLKRLRADGWVLDRTRGSHQVYRHPTKPGIVVVPGTAGKALAPGTLHNILRQAQLDETE